MIQNLKDIVEELVKERTQIQIPEELVKPLIKEVAQAAQQGRGVDVIQRHAETYMFSALQGRILIEKSRESSSAWRRRASCTRGSWTSTSSATSWRS